MRSAYPVILGLITVLSPCRQLHGSIDQEGELEWGFIEPGMKRMFFLNGDRPVKTSRIVSVKVAQPNAVQPKSSPSVH
jgi:hypothetical protein